MTLNVEYHSLKPAAQITAPPTPYERKRKGIMKKEKVLNWLRAAGIRALKTVAQTAIATIGTSAMLSGVDWLAVASASALAGILSLLTSLAGLPECKTVESADKTETDMQET